jgi:agmatinase
MNLPFDPDSPTTGDGIFGLSHSPEEADVVLIPVPWEATTSYGVGTAGGPEAILAASRQVDLADPESGGAYRNGIALLPVEDRIRRLGREARRIAQPVVSAGGADAGDPALGRAVERVNALGQELNEWVEGVTHTWLARGKLVGVVGGDHSAPFGLLRALAELHPGLGILHLDAHADLRDAYMGFVWSHASIMHNVITRLPGVSRLVQVGLRDVGERELALIRGEPERIRAHFDADLKRRLFEGETWKMLVDGIVGELPEEVYLSFDVDGLDPKLCPHTGTPVPGGLDFPEAVYLVGAVAKSGRRIVGLDLVEVAPDPTGAGEYDANVGARLLYKMIGFALQSRAGA